MSTLEALFAPAIPAETVESLRSAIKASGDKVDVVMSLPKSAAEKVLTLLSLDRTGGAVVIPAREEFTPAQASVILGMSRQTVVQHINNGDIAAHKVGAHWRIKADDVADFLEREKAARTAAAARLARATAP